MTERVYLAPEGVAPAGSPRISILWEPFNADNTGATDTTAALNAAAPANAVDVAPGTYRVDGLADVSAARDFTGVGAGAVVFKLGAAGQLRFGQGGGAVGGRIGGFEVDGQGVQNAAGGGVHIAGRNSTIYEDMYIHGCLAPGMLIDGGQNNDFFDIFFGTPGGSEVSLVFDHAVGGLNFYGCELAGGMRVQQTHTDYSGGYFTWVGPSDIHFKGGRCESPLPGLPIIYLAAGSNISLEGFGIAGSNSLVVMEPGAQNYPLKTSAITAWDGGFNITVADASGVTPLMSAKVPNCPPETIVNNVVGNVVTLSIAPTADPTGGTAQFGARMLDLTINGSNGVSGSGTSTAFDMRGNTTLILMGRPKIQNHQNVFLMRHSDQGYVGATPPNYASCTNILPVQQAGDTGQVGDLQALTQVDSLLKVVARNPGASYRSLLLYALGDANPNVVVQKGFVALSDGASYPQNVGISYVKDGDGTEHAYIAGQSARTQTRATVLGDGSTFIRGSFRGMLNAAGPPSTNNGKVGDWCIGNQGSAYVLTVSGTPDTWVATGSLPDYLWPPSRQGLKAWTYSSPIAQGTLNIGAGQGRYQRIYIPQPMTVSTIWISLVTGGSGVTSLANCYMGIYSSSGTRIAVTADQSTAWATAGSKSAALTADAGQSLSLAGGPGVYVWAALLVGTQATTQAAASVVPSNANNAVNANVSPAIAGGLGAALTALPASITPASIGVGAMYWMALS